MELSVVSVVAVICAGFFAGAINALAGGGTYPAGPGCENSVSVGG